jgi:hypothetical protein
MELCSCRWHCTVTIVMEETKAVINTRRYSCKVPIIFSRFNETWILSTDFSKNTSIRIITSTLSAIAEWVHADGPTYWGAESRPFTMKLIVVFPDFVNTTLCSIGREWNSSECRFTAQEHAEEVMKWHKYQEDIDMIESAASGRL